MNDRGYIVVTDYVKANTGEDVSDALQELILSNPHRTIFFPDGEYVIAKPILTPATPAKSVDLQLSNYATIKASDDWSSEEAMIRLGAAEPSRDTFGNGSNYSLTGGIIDGNGVAKGVAIESGRETRIDRVSIKHTSVGLHLKKGSNSNSADADIFNVNIIGNYKIGSIGLLIESSDNSFTNMRIGGVQIGVKISQGASAQIMKNLHVLYGFSRDLDSDEAFRDSIGFYDLVGYMNWYTNCYSDQFATGYYMIDGARHTYSDCYCYWYTDRGGMQHGFHADGKFNAVIRNSYVKCKDTATDKAYLVEKKEGGKGVIVAPVACVSNMTDKTHEKYVVGPGLDWM